MKRTGRISSVAALAACAACVALLATTATGQSRQERAREPAGEALGDRYAVVVENNIFLRQRGVVERQPAPQRPAPTPPPPPERSLVLTGVVFEEGRFRAYVEDRREGSFQRIEAGREIARGRISEVFIDAIGYERDGEVTWVSVGQDLTGATPEPVATATRDAPPQSGPAASEQRQLSLEERLRQRRLQEAGRTAVRVAPGETPPRPPMPPGMDEPLPPDEPPFDPSDTPFEPGDDPPLQDPPVDDPRADEPVQDPPLQDPPPPAGDAPPDAPAADDPPPQTPPDAPPPDA